MVAKVVDGTLDAIKDLLKKFGALLGVYAAHRIIFGMDIPPLALFVIVFLVFWISWLLSAPEPEIKAIPVTVVKPPKGVVIPSKSILVEGGD